MLILLPLADNELQRPDLNGNVYKISTSDCKFPFNHIFFSEIGKLLHFWKTNKKDFESICFIQNRRYFKELNNFSKINDNTVYLAKKENVGKSIQHQFNACHPYAVKIFEDILHKNTNLNISILNENKLSPHNIFYSNFLFFDQYCQFLNDTLVQYFDEKFDKKYGAFISERLLHLFAYSNFNVIEKEIFVLPKKINFYFLVIFFFICFSFSFFVSVLLVLFP